MASGPDWFSREFRAEFDRQQTKTGRFNLAIFGKTGVGKSTLINAIFGADTAQTGIGEPVTKGSHLYRDTVGHLGIVDTQGLEVGRDDKQILAELDKATKQMRRRPLDEQIHLAWFCVRGMDRRFEATEADFVRRLDRAGLPVIVVLTQVPMRDGHHHPDAVALADEIRGSEVPIAWDSVLTFARPDGFVGQQSHGLQELLDASFRCAPKGVEHALAAAQAIDQKRKAWSAQRDIAVAAGSAAAAAAVPIPFSDAASLVPIQLGLMSRIAQLYKIGIERAALMVVASTAATTQGGRSAFTALLKTVPGAGSVTGGAISAAVASAFTMALGQAWLVVCQQMASGRFTGPSGSLDTGAVQDAFWTEFRRRLNPARSR